MNTETDPMSYEAFEEAVNALPIGPHIMIEGAEWGWQECARRARVAIKALEKHRDQFKATAIYVNKENKRLRELLKRGSIHWHPKSKFGKEVSAALEGK